MAGLPLSDDEVAKLNDEQLATLEELGGVAAKKLKLTSAIGEFNQMALASQKHMGFSMKENPSGLHEDPEIQQLLSIKARYKLGNLNEQIRRILRRCVELELGKYALVQRQCEIYSVPCSANGR